MTILTRADSRWVKFATWLPRWVVPAIFNARVGQDYTTFVKIHFFTI